MGELLRQAPAKLPADQAVTGDEDRELVEGDQEIDLALVAPLLHVGLDLLAHDAGIGAQPLVAQRGNEEAHLLVEDLRPHVVDDAGPEDGNRELVDLADAELALLRREERGLGPGPHERRDVPPGQAEAEDLAEPRAAAPQQAHGIAAQR